MQPGQEPGQARLGRSVRGRLMGMKGYLRAFGAAGGADASLRSLQGQALQPVFIGIHRGFLSLGSVAAGTAFGRWLLSLMMLS
jgi:hypothetical protein